MTDQTCANARDLLPALVREELTGEERALVEAHVSSCSSCTDELALIRRLSGAVQKMPAGLASEIKEAVARDRTQKRRTIGWQLPAAAMIVLALGTSLVWQRTQTLPETSQLDTPIYTPATKATDGHDINISPERAGEIIGTDWNDAASGASLAIYERARDMAAERGIILCDTKFEFGVLNGSLTLADEVLTPDSSRFWPESEYAPGRGQPSYDKQFVRDWLEGTDWDKDSPPPPLPDEIIDNTRSKYVEAYERLTGRSDI